MATPAYRPSCITTIRPTTHIIIPDTTPAALIYDGAVIEDITTTIIGVTIDQVVITKTTSTAINEAINVAATVNTIEITIGMVTMDADCDGKLIVRADDI